jgi:hypothetical protein
MKKIILAVFLLLISLLQINAQEIDRWDNWFLLGNKLVFGGQNNIKHSHELQWRVDNNMRSLNVWYYEGVFTYSPNAKWEVVPDFRASIKPDKTDFRFGFGLVRKNNMGNEGSSVNQQLVQQLKYQLDIDGNGNVRHGVRFVATYNRIISEKFVVSGLIGPFYRWSEEFTGIEFVRGGPVFTYIFNTQHTLAFAPLFGAGNIKPDGWAYSFTPMVSLIIRINKDYKYVPAKYINF